MILDQNTNKEVLDGLTEFWVTPNDGSESKLVIVDQEVNLWQMKWNIHKNYYVTEPTLWIRGMDGIVYDTMSPVTLSTTSQN